MKQKERPKKHTRIFTNSLEIFANVINRCTNQNLIKTLIIEHRPSPYVQVHFFNSKITPDTVKVYQLENNLYVYVWSPKGDIWISTRNFTENLVEKKVKLSCESGKELQLLKTLSLIRDDRCIQDDVIAEQSYDMIDKKYRTNGENDTDGFIILKGEELVHYFEENKRDEQVQNSEDRKRVKPSIRLNLYIRNELIITGQIIEEFFSYTTIPRIKDSKTLEIVGKNGNTANIIDIAKLDVHIKKGEDFLKKIVSEEDFSFILGLLKDFSQQLDAAKNQDETDACKKFRKRLKKGNYQSREGSGNICHSYLPAIRKEQREDGSSVSQET